MTRKHPGYKNAGTLSARYRNVPPNVRRVLYRKYVRRLYVITVRYGVTVCDPATFDEGGLIARGYVMVTKTKNEQVWEKTIGVGR